jgi:hypothetical protein
MPKTVTVAGDTRVPAFSLRSPLPGYRSGQSFQGLCPFKLPMWHLADCSSRLSFLTLRPLFVDWLGVLATSTLSFARPRGE